MTPDYKNFAVDLARQAGQIIKDNFKLGMGRAWKADNTPLTITDTTINTLVIESVNKSFPGHSILAEEGSNFSEESEYVWVCDPVDGTTAFSHGIPTCVFSLALVRSGVVIFGVVYDPFLDRLFVAEKGTGAWLNEKPIHVSQTTQIKTSSFGATWWPKALYNLSDLTEALRAEGAKITNVGSITYMGVLVACGEFAATFFPSNKSHDTAALKVIVEEAGGRVTDLFGNEQRYDRDIKGHLVSNGVMHETLLNLIRKHVKH